MFFKRLTKTKSAPAPSGEPEAQTTSGAQPTRGPACNRCDPRPSPDHRRQGPRLQDHRRSRARPRARRPGSAVAPSFRPPHAGFCSTFSSWDALGRAECRAQRASRQNRRRIQTPPDWVYVTNFADPRRPRAISLPAGRASALQQGVLSAIRELAATLPSAFPSEDYRARRRAIDEEFRGGQEDALDAVQTRAAQQNIAVLRAPVGFVMAPMHDGEVVRSEVFSQLPGAMRRDVETRISALQAELESILASAPKADKHRRQQLTALSEEVMRHAIEDALDLVSAAFSDVADVASFQRTWKRIWSQTAPCSRCLKGTPGLHWRKATPRKTRLRRYASTSSSRMRTPRRGPRCGGSQSDAATAHGVHRAVGRCRLRSRSVRRAAPRQWRRWSSTRAACSPILPRGMRSSARSKPARSDRGTGPAAGRVPHSCPRWRPIDPARHQDRAAPGVRSAAEPRQTDPSSRLFKVQADFWRR